MMSYPPEWFNIARILEFPVSATKEVTLQAILDRLNAGIPISSSGALTDTQLRASPVNVTGPLTNSQLRAADVPVSGPLTNVQLRNSDVGVAIVAQDSALIDAFGRLRVSGPSTTFDSKLLGSVQALVWDEAQTSGGGTSTAYNTNQASVTMSVGAATAGVRVRQTKRYFAYQPGKSQLILMTGVLGAGAAGITRRLGYFDAANGLFTELSGSTLRFVRRTFTSGAAVDNAVDQAAWNVDRLDGTGSSGITLDTSKAQIFFVDFEWLGVGRVRFGFVIDGMFIVAHQMLNANSLNLVFMQIPNLPCRYEIVNDGTGAASSLTCICASVISEGGLDTTGSTFGVNRGTTALVTLNDASFYPLIAIRRQSGNKFASVIQVESSIVCTSAATFNWQLIVNPTVVGVAFGYSAVSGSIVEADVARVNTTTLTGGTVIKTGTAASTATLDVTISISPDDHRLGATIADVEDVLVLAVQRITGTTETFYGSMNWRETL